MNEGLSQLTDISGNPSNVSSLLTSFQKTLVLIIDSSGCLTFEHNDLGKDLISNTESIVGKSVSDVFSPDVYEHFKKAFKKNTLGEIAEFCYKQTIEADTEWFMAVCSPILKKNVFDGSIAVISQVTTSKPSNEILKSNKDNTREYLQEIVDERTVRLRNTISRFRKEIEERVIAEERADRLNQILKSISTINSFITTATDTKSLMEGTCQSLVENRGYINAWVFLSDHNGSPFVASATKGSKYIAPMQALLQNGNGTPCIHKSLNSSKPWVSDPSKTICSECPMASNSLAKDISFIMSYKLECHSKIYGTLTVSTLGGIPPDTQETVLFKEICDDIAHALYGIEHKETSRLATMALAESEHKYRALFDNSGMAILFMHEDMIVDCNTRAAEVFACKRDDLIGMKPYELSPPYQADGSNSVEKALKAIDATIAGKPQHLKWLHSRMNGKLFTANVNLNAVKIKDDYYIQAMVDDITAQEKAEAALRQSEESYRTLSDNVPVGLFRSSFIENGILLAVNPMMATMFGYASQDELLHQNPNVLYVNKESRLSLLSELESNGVVENYKTQMTRKDGSCFWASISARLFFQNDKNKISMIDGIITDISATITHEENLNRNLNNLKEAIDGTVSAMSMLVEMKDPYTSGHQKGVALLACAIGKEMGLDDDTIDCIRIASTLHDLGKLNVPLEILNKPGPLNEHEMGFLRTHPTAGYDILKAIKFPWPIAEVIHQHHERQDGSGYPKGLKGNSIMIEASIIAVADVVEAVASRRPYRASMGIDVALDVIRKGSGTVFDKVVVDSCIKLFEEKKFILIDHDSKTKTIDSVL